MIKKQGFFDMNKYWFRKRRGLFSPDLGYGWVPITTEGWISVSVFILGILAFAFYYNIWNENAEPWNFIIGLFFLIALFSIFCHSKTDYSIK